MSDPGNRLVNYLLTLRKGTLTISRASQTITGFGTIANQTYGDAPFTITGVTGGGSGQPVVFSSLNSHRATVSGATVTIIGAGVVSIQASQAGNADYLPATAVTQQFNVAKALLTVTAADATRPFGSSNPLFTGTLSTVVNGDPISAIFTSSATTTTAAGIYGPGSAFAITPTMVDPGNRLGNYDLVLKKGTLTISTGG